MNIFPMALIMFNEYGWKQLFGGSLSYWIYRVIVQVTILISFFLFFRPSFKLFLFAMVGAWLGTIELCERYIKSHYLRCVWRLICFIILFTYGILFEPFGNKLYFALGKHIKPEIVAIFLLLAAPANYLIRTLLGKTESQEGPEIDLQTLRAGRSIGMLERWLLVLLLLCGYAEGLAFVLAMKSLVRFRQFEEPRFAEYYLLGTMYSIFIALLSVVYLQKGAL